MGAVDKIEDMKKKLKMRSPAQIEARLNALQDDDVLKVPAVSITREPSKALKQNSITSKIAVIEWILGGVNDE